MKVKELIERLQNLPQDATIGSFDISDMRVFDFVSIYTNKNSIVDSYNGYTIEDLEQYRLSNASGICDYYIG